MHRRRPNSLARLLVALAVTLGAGLLPARPTQAAPPLLEPIAGDWPTYLHDAQRSAANPAETSLSPATAPSLVKLWAYPTGRQVASSPTIAGGTVYVGSWNGYEYALDATTGALKWRQFLGATSSTVCPSGLYHPPGIGVSSAATLQNGVVYVGGGDSKQNGVVYVGGGDSNWYALDASTGAELWHVFTGDNSASSGHYNWSSPLIYNGFAYIGVASLADCPLVQGQLLQVDLSIHQIVHTSDVVPSGQVGGGIWTSPGVDATTNTLYVTTGTQGQNPTTQPYALAILALDASTLNLKGWWQVPASQLVTDSDWGTSPILFTDAGGRPLVAAINKNGILYAFDRTNVSAGPVWQQQIAVGGPGPLGGAGSVSSGAFGAGQLYMAGGNTTINGNSYGGSVRAFDPSTGAIRWQHGTAQPVIAALAYANGLVVDGAGPTLEVLDAATGTRLYSYTTGGTIYGAPSIAGGQIFAGSVDRSVYTFGLPPGTVLPTSTATPSTTVIPATPTSTPVPTFTGTPTATTARPIPTSTPVPTAFPPATSTSTPTATTTPPPTTITPTPARPTAPPTHGRPPGSLPLTFSVSPSRVVSGDTLTVRIHTAPRARVSVALHVFARRVVATGRGRHRKRVVRVVLLYRAGRDGTTDTRGRLTIQLRITYQTATAVRALLTVAAHTTRGAAGRATQVTIQPPARLLPIRVSVALIPPVGSDRLALGVRTLPYARVVARLWVPVHAVVARGMGKQRRRVVHTRVVYTVTEQGRADAHGRFAARMRITFRPSRSMRAFLTVTASTSHGTATRIVTLTLRPQPHQTRRS